MYKTHRANFKRVTVVVRGEVRIDTEGTGYLAGSLII
jgi:hypothetical protein